MLSIPLIRRDLVSDLVGRHIYLFGAGSLVDDVLNPLAEAGALEGTVVLTEHEGARVAAAVLFRPDLPAGEVPVFSAIATLALSDASRTKRSQSRRCGRIDSSSTARPWCAESSRQLLRLTT